MEYSAIPGQPEFAEKPRDISEMGAQGVSSNVRFVNDAFASDEFEHALFCQLVVNIMMNKHRRHGDQHKEGDKGEPGASTRANRHRCRCDACRQADAAIGKSAPEEHLCPEIQGLLD